MLPQLAVSATIFFCLLMVVNCGAVPSMVRSASIYSKCSQGYIRIYPNGTVIARGSEPGDRYHSLIISTESSHLKLLIYAPEVKRYLCYNQKWNLVGLKISKQRALNRRRCQFFENMTEGYNSYESVAQKGRFISFNPSGEQPRPRNTPKAESPRARSCRSFLKMDHESFNISAHNSKVAGAAGAELRAVQHKPHQQDHARRPRIQADKHRHAKSRGRKKYNDYETT